MGEGKKRMQCSRGVNEDLPAAAHKGKTRRLEHVLELQTGGQVVPIIFATSGGWVRMSESE